MIGTGEGSFVGLSLGLPPVSPLEYPNPGSELPIIMMDKRLGLWFGFEAVRCLCCFHSLMDFHEDPFLRVDIYCVPPSGALITSNMNSATYYQLLELSTLALSPSLLISSSGVR